METPRALWRAFLPPILYWWPFYVTPTFLGLTKSSTVAPHWCIPSHVMPRRLLIRGAQPLIPCTPLSRYRRYKSPCRAIFCLLYYNSRGDNTSYLPVDCRDSTTSSWSSPALLRSTRLLALEYYSSPGTVPPLSYLLATTEISLESLRVSRDPLEVRPQSVLTRLTITTALLRARGLTPQIVYIEQPRCARPPKPLRQQRARRRSYLPTYLMCM